MYKNTLSVYEFEHGSIVKYRDDLYKVEVHETSWRVTFNEIFDSSHPGSVCFYFEKIIGRRESGGGVSWVERTGRGKLIAKILTSKGYEFLDDSAQADVFSRINSGELRVSYEN